MGSRFVATAESSAHPKFKQAVIDAGAGSTMLMLKELVPVRLLKNHFYEQVAVLEQRCATKEELTVLLGKGRAKLGMFDGDLDEGELEIGQIAGLIHDLPSVADLVSRLTTEYEHAAKNISPSL